MANVIIHKYCYNKKEIEIYIVKQNVIITNFKSMGYYIVSE